MPLLFFPLFAMFPELYRASHASPDSKVEYPKRWRQRSVPSLGMPLISSYSPPVWLPALQQACLWKMRTAHRENPGTNKREYQKKIDRIQAASNHLTDWSVRMKGIISSKMWWWRVSGTKTHDMWMAPGFPQSWKPLKNSRLGRVLKFKEIALSPRKVMDISTK